MISSIANSSLSHASISKLASQAPSLPVTGIGALKVHWGTPYIRIKWVGCILSSISTLLCVIILARKLKSRTMVRLQQTKMRGAESGSGKLPFIGVIRRATGGLLGGKHTRNESTSYQNLAPDAFELNESQTNLVPRSRDGSCGKSENVSRAGSPSPLASRDVLPDAAVIYDSGGRVARNSATKRETAYEPMRHIG
jgi:hypothetical protein